MGGMSIRAIRNRLYPLKRGAQRALDTLSGVETRRAENPYATHLPVLVGLARLLDVRSVAEFGCGDYSTLTFLDRAAFSNLERLSSFENDPEWMGRLVIATRGDSRVELKLVEGPMSAAATRADLDGYDLIFVDDSVKADERAATIGEVARKCRGGSVVVIHDFEVADYRRAARAFAGQFTFVALNPHTGVAWNHARLDARRLKNLNSLIRRHRRGLRPDDLAGWVNALEGIGESAGL
ncbi:MAG TPA: class I SAM-dependent methyltransferase [Pyrinomonadaceae bacterium]